MMFEWITVISMQSSKGFTTRAFSKFCGLAHMSVSKKGIAWLIVPFNYAND